MLEATFGILTAAAIVFSIGLWASHTAKSARQQLKANIECKTSSTQAQADTTGGRAPADLLPASKKPEAVNDATLVGTLGIGIRSHAGTNGL